MQDFPKKLDDKLRQRAFDNALRNLSSNSNLIDFTSNDYLGLARNENLFSKTFRLLLAHHISHNGATGSRLLTGNHMFYELLEKRLVEFHETEAALVFNSGYDANVGFFGSVPQRGDFVFYDELIHASIRDGIKMGHAKGYKFAHKNLKALREKIEAVIGADVANKNAEIYVVTESVFSMDGDSPDLILFANYCVENKFHFVVDEAHALGVFGDKGEGLVQKLGIEHKVFARMITFGKAIGSHGAAVLGSQALRDFLINFSRSFIYSTGLTPHSVASIISAYGLLIESQQEIQQRLHSNIAHFRRKLRELKLEDRFIESHSAIQSCVVPKNSEVKRISALLIEKGFDVKAILSPTVAEGQERLRFCLHSHNTNEEIGLVLEVLSQYLK